ncbi:MAG: hypothetical protein WBC05_20445 [Sedimentisphaerales bacterium]
MAVLSKVDGTRPYSRQIAPREAIADAGHPVAKLPGIAEDSPKNSAVSKKSYYLLETGTSRKLYVLRFA